MSIRFSSRIRLANHVLKRDIDGGSALLNLNTKQSYGLDDIGTHMLDVMSASPTITRALKTLEREYDVDREILKKDMTRLVEKLIELKIIELTPKD